MWACLICVGTLASGIAGTFVAQVVDGDLRTTTRNQFYIMLTTAITSGATLVVFVLNSWFTWRKEARQREWDLEDRRHAEADRTRMERKIDTGIQKVDDNTEITRGGIKQAVETAQVAADKSTAADDKLADLRAQFDALKK